MFIYFTLCGVCYVFIYWYILHCVGFVMCLYILHCVGFDMCLYVGIFYIVWGLIYVYMFVLV